jgi:dienelactone hydrolase
MPEEDSVERSVRIPAGDAVLDGNLALPEGAKGLVVFAHGSGSSRRSTRNRYVAASLREAGLGTLLMDLLTPEEEREDALTAALRFDIGLLASRVVGTLDWLGWLEEASGRALGCFGASTGAAAALVAAAQRPDAVKAVVSRGGRPDLAEHALDDVRAPTLLIVGGRDGPVIGMNQRALARLACRKEMQIVPDATHLFEEPGALEEVARLAGQWFLKHLSPEPGREIPHENSGPAPD